jgi:hypothetical protein
MNHDEAKIIEEFMKENEQLFEDLGKEIRISNLLPKR